MGRRRQTSSRGRAGALVGGLTRATAVLAIAAGTSQARAAATPFSAGERAFLLWCSGCHTLALSLEPRRDYKEWRDIVRRMAAYTEQAPSPSIPLADRDSIARFLAGRARFVEDR